MKWTHIPEPVHADLEEKMWRILALEKPRCEPTRDHSMRLGLVAMIPLVPLVGTLAWGVATMFGLGIR